MKAQIHSKIVAIAAAALIGIAMTGSAALARGGGGFGGGHIGGFGGAHMGVVGSSHVGSLGIGHMGGLGVHPMGMPGIAMDRGLDDMRSATLMSRMNWDTTTSAVSTVCRRCTAIAPGRLTRRLKVVLSAPTHNRRPS
jgi:hypothetical protein